MIKRVWAAAFGVALACIAAGPAAAAYCGDVGRTVPQAGNAVDQAAVRGFYEAFGSGCAWDDSSADTLVSVLQASGDHGLDPAIFHANAEGEGVQRDILLTDGALKYAAAMTRGLTGEAPSKIDRAYSQTDSEFADGLIDALAQGDISRWLDSLTPSSTGYVQLVEALRTYRAIEAAGGFPDLPDTLATKPKRRSQNWALLRQRLAMEGDLAADNGSAVFDRELREGLTRFQERNGLRVDGRMSWKTLEALKVPARRRAEQIALNLERLRVSERETPQTRVAVNIPSAVAVFHRNGIEALRMNAVVGKVGHETPTLTSTIDTVILNPTWTVPESIIKNEIKPMIRKDPNYLSRNRMYWAGDLLVQEPGAHNSLGRVKFDFPNRYSVYLHDTPARSHFANPDRAQSHGCVRLEKPVELAEALLEMSWDKASIQEALAAGATRRVPVPEPVPVVISYHTAFVAADGAVNFRADVYGWDAKLATTLAQKAAAMGAEGPQW